MNDEYVSRSTIDNPPKEVQEDLFPNKSDDLPATDKFKVNLSLKLEELAGEKIVHSFTLISEKNS